MNKLAYFGAGVTSPRSSGLPPGRLHIVLLGYPFRWRTHYRSSLHRAHFTPEQRKRRFTTRLRLEARRRIRTESNSACASKPKVLHEFLIGQVRCGTGSGSYQGLGPMRNSCNVFAGVRKRPGRMRLSPCKLLSGSSYSSEAGGESLRATGCGSASQRIPQ
jgi:hypothetical protein